MRNTVCNTQYTLGALFLPVEEPEQRNRSFNSLFKNSQNHETVQKIAKYRTAEQQTQQRKNI